MRSFKKTLGGGVILIAIFCLSFFIFYKRTQKALATYLILSPAVINQPLPDARLINLSGQLLDDERLRRGRVVLVFTLNECPACDQENEFLKTAVGNNQKVRFYDVIPFGQKELALKTAQRKYAFETFYDQQSLLSRSLQIYQVPVKIFVEDGIIKRVWLDATIKADDQAAFKQWLNAL